MKRQLSGLGWVFGSVLGLSGAVGAAAMGWWVALPLFAVGGVQFGGGLYLIVTGEG